MITLDKVTEFIYENCENVKVSKNGTHFLARCPLCGDSKKSLSKRRFNLDYNNGNPIYHCFNCGESGSFLTLYSTLKGISIIEAKKELSSYDPDYLIQKLSKRKRDKVIEEIEYEYHDYIRNDCVTLQDSSNGYIKKQYLKSLKDFVTSRKIKTDVFIAYKGKYQGRYIIPIYDEHNHIVYFQARASNDNIHPKYDNPTLAKGSIIYNKHKFERDKYIIVCEGLIDAATVGNQGTACLGSSISKYFLDTVNNLTNKGVVIAMDNDEPGMLAIFKIIDELILPASTRFFLFPQKYKKCDDLNKFSILFNINNIYEFISKHLYTPTTAYTKLHVEEWRKKMWKKEE